MAHYNCLKCPGYCCSYPVIGLTKRDVERLATSHGLTFDKARTAFTRAAHGRKYIMRRKRDPYYGKICRFFDTKERRCTIYKARPAACRDYPGEKRRCGYYDFLNHERTVQGDPNFVAVTNNKG